MSTKQSAPFLEQHPAKGAFNRAKEALNRQHHPRFGAPHFPPSENLPPQAKRVVRKKPAAAGGSAARASTPEPSSKRQGPSLPARRQALPEIEKALAQSIQAARQESRPAIAEARSHLRLLLGACAKVLQELRAIARFPRALIHSLREGGGPPHQRPA